MFTWGAAASGQLGHHDKVRRTTPAKIESLGEFGPLKAVSCGENHTAVLSRAGHVVTWGCPFDGRLGRASDDRSDPAEVGAFREHGDAWGVPLQVSCGMHHTVVRTDNGCVLTWGNGSGGQLGLGDVEHRDEPCVVPLFGDEAPAVSVSGGSQHTACCTAHGDLYLWGVFLPGPVQTVVEPSLVVVAGGVAVQSVSCSDKNTLALSDGEAYHWWDKNETAERDPQEQGQGLAVGPGAALGAGAGAGAGTGAGADADAWRTFARLAGLVQLAAVSEVKRKGRALRKWLGVAMQHSHHHRSHEAYSVLDRAMSSQQEIEGQVEEKAEMINNLNGIIAENLIVHGRDKAVALIRDRVVWSRKRGFDKWKVYAQAKAKEAELRRSERNQLVTSNKLEAERADMEKEKAKNRHARTQMAAMLAFYRWRSQSDRDLREAEEEKFTNQRAHLVNELGELYKLMLQSSEVESEAFMASLRAGEKLTSQLGTSHGNLQKLCEGFERT